MKYLKIALGLMGWAVLLAPLSVVAQTPLERSAATQSEPTMSPAIATADENFQAGNLTRAVQQWSQAIRQDEDVTRSLFNRSQAFVMLEQYDFALRDINEIIALEGASVKPEVFLMQGIILGNLNRFSEALVSFEQAEYPQPTALIYSNRALVYQRSGNLQSALADMEKAVAWAPTAVNHLNLANLYIQLEDYEPAIEQMSQLLAQNETFFPAYLTRSIAYYNTGQYQNALQDLVYGLTIAPEQPEARYYAGLSLAQLNMREEATQNLIMAADLYLRQNRGDSYHQVLEKMSELGL